MKAVILETFGSGNAPSDPAFLKLLHNAIESGIIIYNVTQCKGGHVEMGKYSTSIGLQKVGVISGHDITTEAAIAKLMFLLGTELSAPEIKDLLQIPIRGEMTIS